MAKPPRNSDSRHPQDPPHPTDDLFTAGPVDSKEESPSTEEWALDDPEPAATPPRPRANALPVQPIASAPPGDFDSPAPLPGSTTPARVPSPQARGSARPPAPPAPREPEVVDPFQIDDDLPAIAPPASAPPGPVSQPDPEPPDLDSPPEANAEAGEPALRRDLWGKTAAAVVLIALLTLFGGILYANRPASAAGTSRPRPQLPMVGKVFTLPDVKSGWRTRQTADLVSMVDVILPTPSRQHPAFLPQVQFTCDPGASQTGFLRFIFLDPDGKISGDVRVVKFSGGTVDPLTSGAVVTGPGTATVYGSLGFMDRSGFVAYAGGSGPRWSVEISESTDYNAKEEGWTKLETIDIRNTTDP